VRVSFRVKLLASHAAVAIAVGAVALLLVDRAVSGHMESQVDRRLEAQAEAVARWVKRAGHPDRLAGRLAGVVGARVTIIDKRNLAVGESQDGAPHRPGIDELTEILTARGGDVGRATRYSEHEAAQVRYVAVPADDDAVVRLGLPIGEIDELKADLRRQLGAGALGSLLVALGLAAFVAVGLTRRLEAAREMAQRIGSGDYSVTVTSKSSDEVGVLTRTLAAAASELEETDARRREFLANVAHEIRTPVTSIRGYAETLDSADVDADTQREFVQTIQRNAIRIGQLVEDLLALEALQAGKGPPLETESVAIAQVVSNVVRTLEGRASDLGATIDVDIDADVSVSGDVDATERILLNLVDNALKHGGANVTVSVSARRRGDRVIVTVADDGPGIPADQRTRVFERFHRGVTTSAGEGSGLGLAIARELAHAMDGALALAADRETGAVFTLELPS
jgi:signal transduction histidine kinase